MWEYSIAPLLDDRDLESVLEVEAASFTNPWTREMYAGELGEGSRCHILVVRAGAGRVIGFCAFWVVLDEMHINNVALLAEYRGRGIGTALLRAALREAARLGARRATLEVRVSNAPARRLYERLGFHPAGTRRGYYSHPIEDALVLWRDETGEPW